MPFIIEPYSKSSLIELLKKSSLANPAILQTDQHVEFFDRYLSKIGTKSILCETDYIDRDYLEDYANYYVRCFQDYERKCSRLHFFSETIDIDSFRKIISNPTHTELDQLNNSYLGFSVIKKLPVTIIGRTCLKTYDSAVGRSFPTVQKYKTHLFGIPLTVNSLAFQEQDQVAAACATSCLWSIFHATGKIFQHQIPSPIEITRAATAHMPAQSRIFPNDSLNIEQMAQAIRHVGLEPHFVSVLNQDYCLKSTIYAYARCGIPLAMVVYLVDTSSSPNAVDGIQHAMTVCGYHLSDNKPTPVGKSEFLSTAQCMDKIYCHDDQIGPFAKMEFDNSNVKILNDGTIQEFPSLTTSWRGSNGISGSKRAVPNLLLVPLYHKIRIPLALIEKPVFDFDAILEEFRRNKFLSLKERIIWDIYLQQQNDFKNEILTDSKILPKMREEIATSKMPRFIWRARASCENSPLCDLLFDATDIAQSGCFHNKVTYNIGFTESLGKLLQNDVLKAKALGTRASSIFNSFI